MPLPKSFLFEGRSIIAIIWNCHPTSANNVWTLFYARKLRAAAARMCASSKIDRPLMSERAKAPGLNGTLK